MAKPYTILGLDIGIGSCGWAILDTANENVIDMGVRLWKVPQEDKTNESLAAKRRAARSARRNTKRNADRAKHCLRLFKQYGLVPEDADKTWLQTIKGDPQPLESRVMALDEPICDRWLAQALYNINARRGYIPHGEGTEADDVEGKKVLKAISDNLKAMKENGWRTVGEMMLEQGHASGVDHGLSRNKGGEYTRCVRMEELLEEVHAIFSAQREYGNVTASEQLEADFVTCMTWEKDTSERDAHVYSTVAPCIYFGDEGQKAAAKACLSFEICSAFERVNNVRIVNPDGTEHPLSADTRKWCMDILFSPVPIKGNAGCKVTYKALRKHLDLDAASVFKGVDVSEEKTKEVATPRIWRKERTALPQDLLKRMLENRELADAIGGALAYASHEDSLIRQLECLELSEEDIKALLKLPFNSKAFSGYGTRSAEALRMLNDAFVEYENIGNLAEAEASLGLKHEKIVPRGKALPPYIIYEPTCSNPVVLRVMAQVRKVVNSIIDEYGMPDEIHIELATKLKQSQKEKALITKKNRERDKSRSVARAKLAEDLHCEEDEVSGSLLRKYELWVEQCEMDLYSGKPISYEKMISDSTYCQIDHILPYSRTCDDSQSNKVLVLSQSNQNKRERSPYEWLSTEGGWDEFEGRVVSSKLPYKKRQKLLERNLAEKEEGFIERNLNDTRYATKSALNFIDSYLEFPDNGRKKHTLAVAGGATSALRSAWGFAGKDREADDCHHAVDAAIVAACNASAVIKIAKASERKYLTPKNKRAELFRVTEPWQGFHEEVEARYNTLIPTRRVEHGGTARLYEDTVYKYLGMNEKGNKGLLHAKGKTKTSGNFVLRKDGSAIKPDRMAFLRLWWSLEKHKYLKEPVYFADFASMRRGIYRPKYFASSKPRNQWPEINSDSVSPTPIILRFGCALTIGGELVRFKSLDTDTGTLSFSSMRKFKEAFKPTKTLGEAETEDFISLIDEDILGKCYKHSKK